MTAWTPTVMVGSLLSDDRGISVGVMYPGEHDPTGVPLIRAGDIQDGRLNTAPAFRLSPKVHREYQRTRLEGGELLMTLVGTPGQCVVVPSGMAGWNAARAIAVMRLRNPSDAKFVRYAIHAPATQHTIAVWCNTTVQATLNLKEIRALPIPWPAAADRCAIAAVLGALDDKIELNRRMNETLEELARTIFKSWFVDFDPVRAKAEGRQPVGMDAETAALFPSRLVESELGPIPFGWELRSLDAIARFRNGLALQNFRPEPGASSLPVIKIAQLRAGSVDGAEQARTDIDRECVVEDGDVLFSWSGSLLVDVWCGGRGALNQHLFKVTSTSTPRWFYLLALLDELPNFRRIAAAKATTMGHIQRHHLSEARRAVPSDALLRQADGAFAPLVSRIVHNRLESRTLAELRDLLLPKLISGELRVRTAEKMVEAAL